MSKIALGTVKFGMEYGINSTGGQIQPSNVEEILNYAKSQGIKLLDTAPAYGNSEQILGDYNVQGFNVVTKTRHFDCSTIGNPELQLLENDLKQTQIDLKQEQIYGLLVHNADDLLKFGSDKLYNRLNDLKQSGKIKKVGVSVYNHKQLQSIINNFDIDLVQLPYNILDHRLTYSGTFKLLKDKKVEVHARSVFLQGLLLMSKQNRPTKFNRWKTLWDQWHEWLNDNQITALEASIRHAVSASGITKVIVGVDTQDQLNEIIIASDGVLPNIPTHLFTDDVDLLNPSNWKKL